MDDRPHVVIVGAGFGGLACVRGLKKAPVDVTLIDKNNYHLFQPLLYQVATAGLEPGHVAQPVRAIVRRQCNVEVIMAEVVRGNLSARCIELDDGTIVRPDYLVIAAGSRTSYFGHDEWRSTTHTIKDLPEALALRADVLRAFEAAEREPDEERRRALLTFVVVGGGPNGVELAGALAELSKQVLAREYRHVDARSPRIILLEMLDRVLPQMTPESSERAARQLAELDVEVQVGRRVVDVSEGGVAFDGEWLDASVVIWSSGVEPVGLADRLFAPQTKRRKIAVEDDCSIPGAPYSFAIGDIAHMVDDSGRPLPALAPVAMQQGAFVADAIVRDLEGRPREPFRYRDPGVMATVGRSRAVVELGRLRFGGLLAWLLWLAVHLFKLVGFRTRVTVLFEWVWSYLTFKRGARIVVGGQSHLPATAQLGEPPRTPRSWQRPEMVERRPH